MRMPDSPGMLPSQKIREMKDAGLICTASGGRIPDESIQPTALELRLSDPRTITINPGEGHMFYADEALRLPRDIYPMGDARSGYAKVGIKAEVVNEDGVPIQSGYNGRLMLRVESSRHHVILSPGVPLAQVRFFYQNPEESGIDPGTLPGYDGYEIWNRRIIMHLNLDGECVGYVSKRTDRKVDGRVIGGNRWEDFFDPVAGCGRLRAGPEDLLIMETIEGLRKPNGGSKPYACMMPRLGIDRLQVNTASFIEYGSEGPQALEISLPKSTDFWHGEGICYIEFYRIAGDEVPDRVYGPGNGNRNMLFLLGPLFRAPD